MNNSRIFPSVSETFNSITRVEVRVSFQNNAWNFIVIPREGFSVDWHTVFYFNVDRNVSTGWAGFETNYGPHGFDALVDTSCRE